MTTIDPPRVLSAAAHFAALIEHSAAAIIPIDLAGIITAWNASAERLLGFNAAEIVGRHISALTPPELHDEQTAVLERLAAGQIVRIETVRLRRDGKGIWVLITAGPIRDAAGTIVGFSAGMFDIHEAKVTQATLRAVASRQSFLLQLGDLLRSVVDPAEIQAVACRLLGERLNANRVYYGDYEQDEDHLTIQHDYHRDASSVAGRWRIEDYGLEVAQLFRAGRSVVVNNVDTSVLITAETRASYASLHIGACVGIPLVRAGRLVMMMAVLQNEPRTWTTDEVALIQETAERTWEAVERGRAEQRLRQSEERLRRALSIKTVGVISFRADGPVFDCNDAFLAMSGFDRADIEAGELTWQTLTPPEFYAPSLVAIHEFSSMGNTTPYEKQYFRKDGSRWWGLFAATRLPDGSGVEFIVDVTARKQLEASLREADRRKDEFLATLGHELRNPLAPIRNGLQLVHLAAKHDAVLQRTIAMMDRQVTHLVHLVDDLLDLGRITAGKIELRRRIVSLKELIASSVEACRSVIEARRHALTVEAPDLDICVDADPDRLAQVMTNLLSNAAKYTENGGRIHVRVWQEDVDALIEVSDTGIGIPAFDLEHVFDLFSQVRTHQGRSEGGLGIGLSLVRSLVSMHGGSVRAFSEGAGMGSRFVVRLPIATLPLNIESSIAPKHELPDTSPKRRVLIADDNVDSALSLAALLELDGHEVTTAMDGVEAVEKAKQLNPDIAILDLGMPRMDGLQAARRIRELACGSRITLVALTGWGQEKDRQRSEEAGFDCHLVKPIEPGALTKLVSQRSL